MWGFGTNPPTDAVTVTDFWCRRPISTQWAPSSAMPMTSSSRSVGSPIRKYSLTRRHPWLNAASTAL